MRTPPARAALCWLLLVAGAWSAGPTRAGNLQAAPISIEIAAGEQSQTLTLTNTGDTPLRAQIRVMDWRQSDGAEDLVPARTLRASPPIVEIPPRSQQLVRIVRPDNSPPATELAYRLIVDELPDPEQADVAGLKLLLRYSIPVFVLPPGVVPVLARTGNIPPTDLSIVTATLDDGQLEFANHGTSRIRISDVAWVNTDGSVVPVHPGLLGYALAGQRMRWPLPLPAGARHGGSLRARFNNDPDAQVLALDRPGR